MHNRLTRIFLILSALLVLAPAGAADNGLTANVGATTNYVFRGESQTDDGPAVQGGIDWIHKIGLYAGAWASNVENRRGDDGFEIDLYAGFNFDLGNTMGIDVGAIAYEYTDNNFDDAQEIYFGFQYGDLSVTYFDGEYDRGGDYYYLDAKYTLALQNNFKLKFHYGHREADGPNNDANDVSMGISKKFGDYDIGLTFTSYDGDRSGDDEDELFATVTRTFDI